MSSYLIKVTEQYRCDSENEAIRLIEEAKQSNQYAITKSSSEVKTVKQKGEIIDEYRRVILVKEFTSEREPDTNIMPIYKEEGEE